MNKIKTLKWLVGILVLLNIVVMPFMWLKSNRQGPMGFNEKPIAKMKSQFGWDDEKFSEFETSKSTHMEGTRKVNEEINVLSKLYYKSTDSIVKDSLIGKINVLNTEVYKINNNHIADIRRLAGPEKTKEFDNFVSSLMDRNYRKRPPHRKRR